jgi:hypothetical protein
MGRRASPNSTLKSSAVQAFTLDGCYRHLIKAILDAECPKDPMAMERLLSLHCASDLYELLCSRYDIPLLAEDNIVGLWETTAAALGAPSAHDAEVLPAVQESAMAGDPAKRALRLAGYYRHLIKAILDVQCPNDPLAMERQLSRHCAFELYELLCERYDIPPLAEDTIVSRWETTAPTLGIDSQEAGNSNSSGA